MRQSWLDIRHPYQGERMIKFIDFEHSGVFEGGEFNGDVLFVIYDNLDKILDILTKMMK